MNRYKKFIKKGVNERISKIPFHNYAPIKRLSMLSKKRFPSSNTHVAVHFVNGNHKKMSEYSMLHKHNVDEINLIISENSKLKYEIQLDDEVYKISSPSTIFIPKGIKHKAKFLSGKGIFVCIILSGKYTSSK
ncbi:MAG: 2-isopropylmalate synthase [Thermoproteota archaeon]|nr:2-isopropylmalate synthase [Thermoproteota archaeon]|tara:strand:+ start:40 stop:438 length:399 start_codon:yes stop_codon:yes gene_type:complete